MPKAEEVVWPDEIPMEPQEQISSWHLDYTEQVLSKFLDDTTSCYVELGSWLGGSAELACRLAPNALIVCFDLWDWCGIQQYEPEVARNSLAQFQANLWEHRHRVVMIRGDTLDGISAYCDDFTPQVIFIDADHQPERFSLDLVACRAAWPDSQICGDDLAEVERGLKCSGNRYEHISRVGWWLTEGE